MQPFVVIGQALAKRGHVISIAASSGFAEMIAAAGLTHHVLPVDFQQLLQEPEVRDALNSFKGKLKAFRWTKDLMNKQFDALWQIGCETKPDVILHHFKSGIAAQIARKVGAISAPIMLQPGFAATQEYPQFLIASRSLGRLGNLMSHRLIQWVTRAGTNMMVKRWQKATGTDIGPPMDPLAGYNPHGDAFRIHAYSSAIIARPSDWPNTEIQTGYFFADPEPFKPAPELEAFLAAGPPPIYIGFGSMPGMDEDKLTRAVTKAIANSGHRAIIATGWGALRQLDASDNVHIIDAVPHTWLFPRVSAVVHHGGSGTTHEGLRWGRPTIICPLFADQPFFGHCVYELGAGPKPIPQKKLTGENLQNAIEIALSQPTAENAAAIGQELQKQDGVKNLCDIVDRLKANGSIKTKS